MATVEQSVQEQIAALARRHEAGEMGDADYDSAVLQLLPSQSPPARPVSSPDSVWHQATVRSNGHPSPVRRWPVIALVAVALVLLVGLGAAGANLMSLTSQLDQKTAKISDLQEQTKGYQTLVATLTSDNAKLQQEVATPKVTLINLQGHTSGGQFYYFGVPARFSISIDLASSSPVDVRLFSSNQFLAWYVGGAVKGQGSSSAGWSDRTSLSNAPFDGARGCADYVLVIDGNSSSITLTATGTWSPSSTPTGVCAR